MAARRLMQACLAAALGMAPAPSLAQIPTEALEADISAREIAIESTFAGVRIVVFGTVLHSRQPIDQPGIYDVVVVIQGPNEPVVVRRKSRVAGIWINTESQRFESVPGYYAVLSTGPLADLSDPQTLQRFAIGFENLPLVPAGAKADDARQAEFRAALVRLKERQGLFRASEEGVEFIGSHLFRATVDLPANVPIGEFSIDIYLFRDGKLLNHHLSRLVIRKQGFEELVHRTAFEYPLLYGILAVVMAISAGLLASAVFRRD